MKLLLFMTILFLIVDSSYGAPPKKMRSKPVEPVKAPVKSEERVEQFAELKLHGQLKRPELNYRFEDEMSQELKNIEVPRNFDNELVQDIERR
jgi:hypothetical protein